MYLQFVGIALANAQVIESSREEYERNRVSMQSYILASVTIMIILHLIFLILFKICVKLSPHYNYHSLFPDTQTISRIGAIFLFRMGWLTHRPINFPKSYPSQYPNIYCHNISNFTCSKLMQL